jgi:hypothetical protein
MMNRLTIIKSDNLVGIDGQSSNVDCSSLPENFHALQWNQNESIGEIEWNGNPRPGNTIITELGEYDVFVDLWKKVNRIPTEKPTYTDSQICVEVEPTKIDGEWYQTWEVRTPTPEELTIENERLVNEINVYRDQKIADGFLFNGVMYDSRPEDQKRISGSALLAHMAIQAGAQANNYYWHGGTDPFVWIAKDNSTVPMDAFDTVSFGKRAADHERLYIFHARVIKDSVPIPRDYANTIYWPVSSDYIQ